MIEDEHQGKGYGGEATAIAYQQTRAWGLSKLQTSVVPGNNCPMSFYEKHGLKQTGKMLDKEIELMGLLPA